MWFFDWLGRKLARFLRLPGTLSDTDILAAMARREIGISPFEPSLLQRAGYAFRLGGTILVPRPGQIVNPLQSQELQPQELQHDVVNLEELSRNGLPEEEWLERFITDEKLRKQNVTREQVRLAARGPVEGRLFGYPLFSDEFVLGATLESLTLDRRHKVKADGRSSVARKGLTVHQTAMNIWPGHGNPVLATVTLELKNVGPHLWLLVYGYQVGNFIFERMVSPASETYGQNGRYSDQGDRPGQPVSRPTDIILPKSI